MNSCHFPQRGYQGIDINPRYVAHARRRYHRDFVVADACDYARADRGRFDFVLANSVLHHLDDGRCKAVLSNGASLLTTEGTVNILDLVLPERRGVALWLARHDRGEFARPLEAWRTLFEEFFQPIVFEPFAIRVGGVELLRMIYFKGRRLSRSVYTGAPASGDK